MSLHCPATVWVVPHGTTPEGLLERVGEERVSALYVAGVDPQTAKDLGRALALDPQPVPGGTVGSQDLDVQAVADLHRGECAVLVVPAGDTGRPARHVVGD